MSAQESVQVIQAYFQNHDGLYLAENVEFYDMATMGRQLGFIA